MIKKALSFLLVLVLCVFTLSSTMADGALAVSFNPETGVMEEVFASGTETEPQTVFAGHPGDGEPEDTEDEDPFELAMGGTLGEGMTGSEFNIFGSDDRIILKQQRETFPYRAVVYLDIKFPKGSVYGTGFMIGPHYVLTNGHCVYQADKGGCAESITVYPGRSRNLKPYGSTTFVWLSCMSEWYYSEDFSCDLGLIETKAAIGNKVGWFGYFYPSDDDLYKWATLIGYGGDTGYMYESSGYLNGTSSEGNIKYTIDTLPGSSGSPIMMNYNGEAGYAIGVNNCHNSITNKGVRFTQKTVDFFKEYHGK